MYVERTTRMPALVVLDQHMGALDALVAPTEQRPELDDAADQQPRHVGQPDAAPAPKAAVRGSVRRPLGHGRGRIAAAASGYSIVTGLGAEKLMLRALCIDWMTAGSAVYSPVPTTRAQYDAPWLDGSLETQKLTRWPSIRYG